MISLALNVRFIDFVRPLPAVPNFAFGSVVPVRRFRMQPFASGIGHDRARKAVTHSKRPASGKFQGGPVARREIRHRQLSEVAVIRQAKFNGSSQSAPVLRPTTPIVSKWPPSDFGEGPLYANGQRVDSPAQALSAPARRAWFSMREPASVFHTPSRLPSWSKYPRGHPKARSMRLVRPR